MENQEKKRGSFLPLMFIGLITVFFLQYLNDDPPADPESQSKSQSTKDVKDAKDKFQDSSTPSPKRIHTKNDFQFSKAASPNSSQEEVIETDTFFVILSSRGGRIKQFYVKSNDDLLIPQEVIAETNDPIAKKQQALEITRGLGMDFQPHIYYSGEQAQQLAEPILNGAAFQRLGTKSVAKIGVHEISYSLPLRFRGQNMELSKIYRFYKGENYFRQITILRNLERRALDLSFQFEGKKHYGSLFYKPFSDLGPETAAEEQGSSALNASGRFFYYNKDLKKRSNHYQSGGGGCAFPTGCTSLDKGGLYSSYVEAPNSLEFMGSHSRYFLAYTEFLTTEQNDMQRPDGFVYKNEPDPKGQAAMTAIFNRLSLGS